MLLRHGSLVKSSVSLAVLSFSLFFAGCSDEKKPEEAVQPSAAELPAVPGEDGEFKAEMVHFAFDSSTITPQGQDILNALADHLKKSPNVTVQIAGHCDARGTPEYNMALGERRAFAVKTYLTQLGVDGSRVSTVSYGKEKPLVMGHDEAAWAQNRRAEFELSSH